MSRSLNFSILSVMVLAAIGSVQAQEDATKTTSTTTVTTKPNGTVVKRTIVTTVPAPKEVVDVPTGYASCFTVKGDWDGDVWVAEHSVCSYSNSTEGLVWIQGYWACSTYNQGECSNWDWKKAHWEKTVTVY